MKYKFWKKRGKNKSLLDEIAEFLDSLQKEEFLENKLSKDFLEIVSIEDRIFERVLDICKKERYIQEDSINLSTQQTSEWKDVYVITSKGLKFLEEYQNRAILNEHNRTILYLSTILVLTTILSTFLSLKLVNPLRIIITYAIIVLFVTIIFKKSKVIKV